MLFVLILSLIQCSDEIKCTLSIHLLTHHSIRNCGTQKSTHPIHGNLEQNVYSNQKEELDKRLNHSERSIFIEYLYIVMTDRQKKVKTNIQMENEENSVSDIALCF